MGDGGNTVPGKEKRMEKFHIWDVISLLNLPDAPSGRSSYYIPLSML